MHSRKRWETDEAFTAAQELGIDFNEESFDLEEFRLGMCVELVHGTAHPDTDVTHDDPVATAKLVLVHLREIPDFYSRLGESCAEIRKLLGRPVVPA